MAWHCIVYSPYSFGCLCISLTLLVPQSPFGNDSLKFRVVCPRNGTVVLLIQGLSTTAVVSLLATIHLRKQLDHSMVEKLVLGEFLLMARPYNNL